MQYEDFSICIESCQFTSSRYREVIIKIRIIPSLQLWKLAHRMAYISHIIDVKMFSRTKYSCNGSEYQTFASSNDSRAVYLFIQNALWQNVLLPFTHSLTIVNDDEWKFNGLNYWLQHFKCKFSQWISGARANIKALPPSNIYRNRANDIFPRCFDISSFNYQA